MPTHSLPFFSAVTTALLLLATLVAPAQIRTPAASPLSTVTQHVGLATITITYSRPGAKGRPVFGAGSKALVPDGQRWRTGANATTSLTFSQEVVVEGIRVPAGEYGHYTIPGPAAWTIVLNKSLTQGAEVEGFREEQDVARFAVKPYRLARQVETFAIGFTNLTAAAATVNLEWELTGVKFTIAADPDREVLAQIDEKVGRAAAPAVDDLATAAAYYNTTNRDLPQALRWIKQANALSPHYTWLNTEAHIRLKLRDYEGTILAAEQSKKLALANVPPSDYAEKADKLIDEAKKLRTK